VFDIPLAASGTPNGVVRDIGDFGETGRGVSALGANGPL